MKRLLYTGLALLTCFAGTFLTTSCSDDKDVAAPTIKLSETALAISRTGYTYQGELPSVEVTSNVWWSIDIDATPAISEADPWLRFSDMAGTGSMDLDITITPNTGESDRSARVKFVSNRGVTETLVITQKSGEEDIRFYTDGFGTTASGEVGSVAEHNATGIGVEGYTFPTFKYEGAQATYNTTNASSGTGASGGSNILLTGYGSYLEAQNVRALGITDFVLSFFSASSASSPADGDLKVEISQDGVKWYEMKYIAPSQSGWEKSVLDFSLAEEVNYLYFRFRNMSQDGNIYIDDISLVDGVPSGNVYDVKPMDYTFVGANLPVIWNLTKGTKPENDLTFNYRLNDREFYVMSEIDADAGVALGRLSYEIHGRPYDHDSDRKTIIGDGGQPYASGVELGDYWLFTVPVNKITSEDVIHLFLPTRSSGTGPRYWMLEVEDGGQWIETKEPQYNATHDVSYTHMLPDDGTYLFDEFFQLENGLLNDTLRIRFRPVSLIQANGNIPSAPTGGTTRISGDAENRPFITIVPAEPEEIKLQVSGLTYNSLIFESEDIEGLEKELTIKSNYYWNMTLENLSWLKVTPQRGDPDRQYTVSVLPENNESSMSRTGRILLVSGSDTLRIVVTQGAAGGTITYCDLPQTLVAENMVRGDEREILWVDSRRIMAEGELSYIDFVKYPGNRVAVPFEDPAKYDSGIYVSAGQPTTWHALLNDAWTWILPVNYSKPNNKLKLTGKLRASAKGPRFLILEWSVDNKNWNEVNVLEKVVNVEGVNITARYTEGMEILTTANAEPYFSHEFTVGPEVTKGRIYVRCRISTNISQDLVRTQTSTQGTHRITGTWVIEEVN